MRQTMRQRARRMLPVLPLILPLMFPANRAMAALPITFEENRGQVSPEVAFLSRTAGYRVFLTREGAVITLQDGAVVRINLANSRQTIPLGTHRLVANTNYLIGADPARWRSGIANYEAVTYPQVYPGIDLTWHTHGDQIEHDFLIAAGADPRRIRLVFSGASLRITPEGDLVAGTLRFHKPRAYQDGSEVECRYELRGRSVQFVLGPYDHGQSLTIDPVLSFSTFLGGTRTASGAPSTNKSVATALDAAGNLYVVGTTTSVDFPVTPDAIQGTASGLCGYSISFGHPILCNDIFVAKLSGDGSTLLYATYLGSTAEMSTAIAIAVGPGSNLYILGTAGHHFPKLAPLPGQTLAGTYHFVAALSSDGSSLLYATALPAALFPVALAVDLAGAVFLTGVTYGGGLPTVNAFQQSVPEGRFFKTADAGAHWQELGNGLPSDDGGRAVAADPTNPQVLYLGTGRGLYKTTDGGTNWSSLRNGMQPAPGISTSSIPTYLVIDPHSPQTLYLGTSYTFDPAPPSVYKSTDGGATWIGSANGVEGRVSALTLDPTNPSILYAGTESGLYKSTDGAATWKSMGQIGAANNVKAILGLAIDPTNPATIYLANGSGVMKSTDGGGTWNAMNNGFAVDPGVRGLKIMEITALAIDPASPQTLYAGTILFDAGVTASVYVTTNGGTHWTQTAWPFPGAGVQSFLVDPRLHSRVWTAASEGVCISVDSGATWSRISIPHSPVIALAADTAGAIYAPLEFPSREDAFAMKLDATGSSIVYSTYLGGMGIDVAGGIAVDAAGRAYIAGETDSPDFPIAAALQPSFGGNTDAFVTVLDPSGSHLVWSTYLGGTGGEGAYSIALDPAGNVHLAGIVSPTGTLLQTYKYLIPENEIADDVLAAKIKGDGSAVIFFTRLGGSDFDGARSVAADAAGNTYVAGSTRSKDLHVVDAVQPTLAGKLNALVAKFDGRTGAVQYASYLGGSQFDYADGVVVDAAGNAYVIGATASPDFPLKSPLQSSNTYDQGFVAKLAGPRPAVGLDRLVNAASYAATVAPGELISLFGTALASNAVSPTQLPLPTQLLDAQVTVNGVAAPLVYVSPRQVNAQIPFETPTGTAHVQVSSSAGTATMTVQVAPTSPAIFTLNQQGTGAGAILHGTTYQVVTDANPAAAGEIISIYATGLGAVDPPAQTGAAPPDPPPQTVIPVQVSIARMTAQVLYAGVAPGFPGLYQVNARIPEGTPSGTQPLQIIQNGVASNTVTIAVQ